MNKRVIITVLGRDTVGIIARICTYLAGRGINILDISQTIVQDFFDMIMIVDMSGSSTSLGDAASDLEEIGKELGLKIKCQSEEIFDSMHRI